ncbi:TraU family protein [Mucispirillum schaedleri]|uniref:TraU family protein n=1 Tax=Mucispirillum schaedleri TaxID=248039 RepID=UPI001F56DC1C|nr:TraU family protein [Mucispirillum schaedleri]
MLKYLVNIKITTQISSIIVIYLFFMLPNVFAADTGKMACKRAGVKADTFMNIQTAAFETIDNMLPIKIGAIEIDNIDNTQGGLADMGGLGGGGGSDTDGTFLCMCQVPPPVFERLGVTMSFWNNVGMIDTSSIPYCFPQLGQYLDLGGTVGGSLEALTGKAGIGGANQFGKRSSGGKQKGDQFISAHTHFASFTNLMKIVSDAIFSMCFSADMATNISPQMSEVFFWWQNDEWGVLKNPEALLVANPIATAACMAESLSVSILGTSLDPLFWCMGSWGSLYPITMNVGSGTPLTSYAMLAARNLSERFQLAMLMDTTGYQMLNGYCQPYPTYFIPKKDVNIYPIWPQKFDNRFPLGYPSEIWGFGLDNPANIGVMTWMVYQKRDCCYL